MEQRAHGSDRDARLLRSPLVLRGASGWCREPCHPPPLFLLSIASSLEPDAEGTVHPTCAFTAMEASYDGGAAVDERHPLILLISAAFWVIRA